MVYVVGCPALCQCSPPIAPTRTRATGTRDQGAKNSCISHERCFTSKNMVAQQHSPDRYSAFSEIADKGAVILQGPEAPTAMAGILNRISLPEHVTEWLAVIQRVWDHHRMRPYPRGWLTLSADPGVAAKLGAIIDLHLAPPINGVVFYVDEKPISGMLIGGRWAPRGSGRRRHRIGVVFAALDPVSGKIIARYMRRQRSREFIRFLDVLSRETPARQQVHLILDNFAPHKHATVQEWLSRHSQFKLHFSPAGMSWTNLVELFFSDLARRRLKWGTYSSASELRAAVANFITPANVEPRFQASIIRGRAVNTS